jgi:hypothetical protein
VFAVGGFLLVVLFGCLVHRLWIQIDFEVWQSGIERAAHNVGAEPTLEGLAQYITETIYVGMSEQELEQTLEVLAPVEVTCGETTEIDAGWGSGGRCDSILLELSPLPGHEWRIIACYNSVGELVLIKSADPDFPLLSIFAPIQE